MRTFAGRQLTYQLVMTDAADLIHVLAAGKYEDDVPQNTAFAEGDWNGDGEFTTADLVVAFAEGHYVDAGPLL